MLSELPERPPSDHNAFVPEDWEAMTTARRRAYVFHLIGVRDRLRGLLHASDDGEALRAVVEEVEEALAALRVGERPGGRGEA